MASIQVAIRCRCVLLCVICVCGFEEGSCLCWGALLLGWGWSCWGWWAWLQGSCWALRPVGSRGRGWALGGGKMSKAG